jgi:hypothetical protein
MAQDALDKLSVKLNGMSRERISDIAGTAPADRHLCPLCGGQGDVADAALLEYVNGLQTLDQLAAARATRGA